MERRNFLKSSALLAAGSAITPFQGVGASNTERAVSFGANANADVLIDPIVPVRVLASSKQKILQQLIEIKKVYGLKRFLVTALDKGMKPYPEREEYRRVGETVLEVKNALQEHGIEVGWWCAPSIRSGYSHRFKYYVTDISGKASGNAPCPLDPSFREEFSDNFAMVVAIAKPSMAQIEDDFLLSWQPPNVNFGCFCPLHLSEFSKRQGRKFTREGLMEIFSRGDEESVSLRVKWAELSRDTLADFAKLIRQKVDRVSPETRISLCQASNCDFDGDFTEAVARAFAGSTRPITRLYGTSYASDVAITLPTSIFPVLYHRQHLPADIECIHESDTYPHLRFFMSAMKMQSFMTAVFAYGVNDSFFYPLRSSGNLFEERGYLEMFKREVGRFSAVKKEAANAPVAGCEIVHLPFASAAVTYKSSESGMAARPKVSMNPWVHVLGRMGIPYTTKGGKVKLVSGDALKFMGDDEIKELLYSGLMLDGYAAYVLSQKGYGSMIGAAVTPDTESKFAGGASSGYLERVRNIKKHKHIKTGIITPFTYVPGSKGGAHFYVLKPEPGAEIITDFIDPRENLVMPGSMRFENKMGGRVYITAYDLHDNDSAGVFNYTRKELLRETIEWLGREQLPVFVNDLPNVFCICNKSNDGSFLLITIVNLSADEASSLSVDVPTEWANAKATQLHGDGSWTSIMPRRSGRTLSLKANLMLMEPIVLKLSRKGV